MSKMGKVKKFVSDNKDELLVAGLVGVTFACGIWFGKRLEEKAMSKVMYSLAATYDEVNGTNLKRDLLTNSVDHIEKYRQIYKGA